jgi:predicted site-specific integrase-resolvase
MADKLLTFNQVADFYSVTPRTVRNWSDKGAIPVVRTPSGQPRIPSSALGTKNSETGGNAGG